MPLTISDELLQSTGMSESEARVEIACRLFEAGKLTLWAAAKWAGLSRVDFEGQLLVRKIPLFRPTPEEVEAELTALDRLGI